METQGGEIFPSEVGGSPGQGSSTNKAQTMEVPAGKFINELSGE